MPWLQVGADDPSNMGIPSVQRRIEATRVIFASSGTKSCVLSSELRFPNLIVSLAARRHSLTGEEAVPLSSHTVAARSVIFVPQRSPLHRRELTHGEELWFRRR